MGVACNYIRRRHASAAVSAALIMKCIINDIIIIITVADKHQLRIQVATHPALTVFLCLTQYELFFTAVSSPHTLQ